MWQETFICNVNHDGFWVLSVDEVVMQNIDSLVQRLGCLSEWGWQSHNKLSFLKKKNKIGYRVEREKKKATSEGGSSLFVKLFYKIVNVC